MELKGCDLTLNPNALISAVASRLDLAKIAVFHPGLYPSLPGGDDLTTTAAFKQLRALVDARARADAALRKAEQEKALPATALAALRACFDAQAGGPRGLPRWRARRSTRCRTPGTARWC